MPDKRQRFVELAEKRVNKVIDDLRLVGNLSNRGNYIFSEEDSQKIIAALENEVRSVKRKFESSQIEVRPPFKL